MIAPRRYHKVFAALNAVIDAYRGHTPGSARLDRATAIRRITALGFTEADAKRWLDQPRKRK